MSAIYGIINLENKFTIYNEGKFSLLENVVSKYKIDGINNLCKEGVFLGQGIQCITNYEKDEMDILENDNLIVITDAIIDNRNKLLKELNLHTKDSSAKIILELYKKYKESAAKKIIGDFTFVVIDKIEKKIIACKDHCAHRSLYYFIDKNNNFVFSTTINPILVAYKNEMEISKEWIEDYTLGLYNKETELANKTVQNKIKRIPPASTLRFQNEQIKVERYWNPLEMERLKFNSYEECDAQFRKLFEEVVIDKIQTNGEVGILLSGGLDSTSVAAFASKYLKEKGLYGFTSVPVDFYKNDEANCHITNEKPLVEKLKLMYPNIDVQYCDGEGQVPLEIIDEILENIEIPLIAIQGFSWLNQIGKEASKRGCKVVLSGQFGNLSISYGDFLVEVLTLKNQKKYFKLYKSIKDSSRCINKPKRVIYRKIKSIFATDKYQKLDEKFMEKYKLLNKSFLNDVFGNDETIETYEYKDFESSRQERFDDLMKTKIGYIDTVMGLKNGLVYRDPTKDKRIIEFTLRLTHEYFVREGKDRALIRESMKDLLPKEIVYNFKQRGYQSADWIQREERKLDYTKKKLEEILECDFVEKYIDREKVKVFIDDLSVENLKENSAQLIILIKIYILHRYYIKCGFDSKSSFNLDVLV
ncbi:MAG: asparagine synthase-related protein [Sarcina sp.]